MTDNHSHPAFTLDHNATTSEPPPVSKEKGFSWPIPVGENSQDEKPDEFILVPYESSSREPPEQRLNSRLSIDVIYDTVPEYTPENISHRNECDTHLPPSLLSHALPQDLVEGTLPISQIPEHSWNEHPPSISPGSLTHETHMQSSLGSPRLPTDSLVAANLKSFVGSFESLATSFESFEADYPRSRYSEVEAAFPIGRVEAVDRRTRNEIERPAQKDEETQRHEEVLRRRTSSHTRNFLEDARRKLHRFSSRLKEVARSKSRKLLEGSKLGGEEFMESAKQECAYDGQHHSPRDDPTIHQDTSLNGRFSISGDKLTRQRVTTAVYPGDSNSLRSINTGPSISVADAPLANWAVAAEAEDSMTGGGRALEIMTVNEEGRHSGLHHASKHAQSRQQLRQSDTHTCIPGYSEPSSFAGSFTTTENSVSDSSLSAFSHNDSKSELLERLTHVVSGWLHSRIRECFGIATTHAASSADAPTGAAGFFGDMSLGNGVNGSSASRKRGFEDLDGRRDQDEGENGDGKRPRIDPVDEGEEQEVFRNFACPFYQRRQGMYQNRKGCPGPGWPEVRRVKDHLYKHHILPIRCNRCGNVYTSDLSLKDHQKAIEPCLNRDLPFLEGIDPAQEKKLRSRKGLKGLAEEEKWRRVYRILFPYDDPEYIPSPFYDAKGKEKAVTLNDGETIDYVRYEFPAELRQEYASEIERALDPNEEKILNTLPRIIHRVLSRRFLTPGVSGEHWSPQLSDQLTGREESPEAKDMNREPAQIEIQDPNLNAGSSQRTDTSESLATSLQELVANSRPNWQLDADATLAAYWSGTLHMRNVSVVPDATTGGNFLCDFDATDFTMFPAEEERSDSGYQSITIPMP